MDARADIFQAAMVVEQFPGTFYTALAEEQIAKLERAAPPRLRQCLPRK